MAQALVERFGGEVPTALEDLVTLPGVGRKTGQRRAQRGPRPARPAGRHPRRPAVAAASASPTETDPVKVELELNAYLPPRERGAFSLRLILHGRRVCVARTPALRDCVLADICPSSRVPGRPSGERSRTAGSGDATLRPLAGCGMIGRTNQVPATWFEGDAGIRRLASPRATAPQGAVAAFSAPLRLGQPRGAQPVAGRVSARRRSARRRRAGRAVAQRPLGLEQGGRRRPRGRRRS